MVSKNDTFFFLNMGLFFCLAPKPTVTLNTSLTFCCIGEAALLTTAQHEALTRTLI